MLFLAVATAPAAVQGSRVDPAGERSEAKELCTARIEDELQCRNAAVPIDLSLWQSLAGSGFFLPHTSERSLYPLVPPWPPNKATGSAKADPN